MESSILVIDIGGTNFRAALFNCETQSIDEPIRFPSPSYISNPNIPIGELQGLLIKKIIEIVKYYTDKNEQISVVGLSFPAPITSFGVVTQASTLWGDKGRNYPLLKELNNGMPKFKWVVTNDITAATNRYANMKKYMDIDYFAVITISSGIGSKIYDVKNKRVLLDRQSIGGEMGHIKVEHSPEAALCDCGARGHIGAYSSGRAVERLTIAFAKNNPNDFKSSYLFNLSNKAEDINNHHIIEALKNGDIFMTQILDRSTFYIANAISHISGNIGADKYILIGGFALNCGESYLESLKRNLLKVDFFGRTQQEILNMVELGINDDNDALIGIGLYAQQTLTKSH